MSGPTIIAPCGCPVVNGYIPHVNEEPVMHTITATTDRQQEALNWMLGKALPEGFEHLGLVHDEEWEGQVADHDTDFGAERTKQVVLAPEHVEPFLSECEDGVRILLGIAEDWQDPSTRGVARALQNLIDRERASV